MPRMISLSKSGLFLKWAIRLLVVFGLLGFLGLGALNAYFSSDRILSQIKREVGKNFPEWDIRFQSAGLGLSGPLPRLVLEIGRIELRGEKHCRDWNLKADRIQVGFSWKYLLRGIVQIRPIKFEGVFAAIQELEGCEAEKKVALVAGGVLAKASDEKSEAPSLPEAAGPLSEAFSEPLFSSLSLDRAQVVYNGFDIEVKNLITGSYFPGRRIPFKAEVSFFAAENHRARPHLHVDVLWGKDEGRIKADGKWREGVVSFEGEWKKRDFRLQGQFQHLPLFELMHALNGRSERQSPMPYQSAWLSCRMVFEKNEAGNVFHSQLDACGITGELGEVTAGKIVVDHRKTRPSVFYSNFDVELKKVQVEKILKSLRIDMLGGVLADYGTLDAKMKVDRFGRLELIGQVRDVIVSFSNQGVRGRQKVPLIEGKFFYDKERVSGQLLRMTLENGSFEGGMSFNFNKSFSQGALQVNISQIQFDPTIQGLLSDGLIQPMAIFGKLSVENDVLTKWGGVIGTDLIENENYRLQGVKVQSEFQNGRLHLNVRSASGFIKKNSPLFQWLRPVFRKDPARGEKVPWRGLAGELLLRDRATVRWSKGRLIAGEVPLTLESEGEWTKDGVISGWIKGRPSGSGAKAEQWSIEGSAKKPELLPEYKDLKKLAK